MRKDNGGRCTMQKKNNCLKAKNTEGGPGEWVDGPRTSRQAYDDDYRQLQELYDRPDKGWQEEEESGETEEDGGGEEEEENGSETEEEEEGSMVDGRYIPDVVGGGRGPTPSEYKSYLKIARKLKSKKKTFNGPTTQASLKKTLGICSRPARRTKKRVTRRRKVVVSSRGGRTARGVPYVDYVPSWRKKAGSMPMTLPRLDPHVKARMGALQRSQYENRVTYERNLADKMRRSRQPQPEVEEG